MGWTSDSHSSPGNAPGSEAGRTRFIVSAREHGLDDQVGFVQQAVVELSTLRMADTMGDKNLHNWYGNDPSPDHLGCDRHPSPYDGKIISGLLNTFIGTLLPTW